MSCGMSVQGEESCGFSESMNRTQRDKAAFSEPYWALTRQADPDGWHSLRRLGPGFRSSEHEQHSKWMDPGQELQTEKFHLSPRLCGSPGSPPLAGLGNRFSLPQGPLLFTIQAILPRSV